MRALHLRPRTQPAVSRSGLLICGVIYCEGMNESGKMQNMQKTHVVAACGIVGMCVVVCVAAVAFYVGMRYGGTMQSASRLFEDTPLIAYLPEEQAQPVIEPGDSEQSPLMFTCDAGKQFALWSTTVMNSPGPGSIYIPDWHTVVYVKFDNTTHILTRSTSTKGTTSSDMYSTDDLETNRRVSLIINQPNSNSNEDAFARIVEYDKVTHDHCVALQQ